MAIFRRLENRRPKGLVGSSPTPSALRDESGWFVLFLASLKFHDQRSREQIHKDRSYSPQLVLDGSSQNADT